VVRASAGLADLGRAATTVLAKAFRRPEDQIAAIKIGSVVADAFEKGVGFVAPDGREFSVKVIRRRNPRRRRG
jgi:hypothetical protein